MKIIREKRIREEYTSGAIERIARTMVRTVTGETKGEKRKSYRNICQETGRARGIVRKENISRMVYRSQGDRGEIEGVRRASW